MNKLLGFEEITPFVRFAPPPSAQYCRALEFMERECNHQNTVVNGETGAFWKAVNDALIELLNGMEIKNMLANTSSSEVPTNVNQLNMSHHLWHMTLNSGVFKTVYKGENLTSAAHANEARLPRSGANVICEFLTRPFGHDTRDAGPKTSVTEMHWQTPYNATGGQYISGYMEFRDIAQSSVRSPAKYPVRVLAHIFGLTQDMCTRWIAFPDIVIRAHRDSAALSQSALTIIGQATTLTARCNWKTRCHCL